KRHSKALTATERVLGMLHPDTISSKQNLARLLEDRGRYHRAELMYKEVLAAWKTVGIGDHPSLVNTMARLSLVLKSQGKLDEAGHIQARVCELSKRIF